MPIIGGRQVGVRGLGFQGAGKPSQVTGLTATDFGTSRAFNDGRIDLSWSTPADNGAPITGYRIERSTDNISYSAISVNTGTTSTTYSDTGLNSNQIYYYKVGAINAVDTGDLSTAANATSTTVPQAPTIGTATVPSVSGTISVPFTAGATGGKAISTFTATSSPGSITGTSASSPITVSGLTNGTAYTFTVTATNANGVSLASSASNSVTPLYPAEYYEFNSSSTWTPNSYPATYIAYVLGGGGPEGGYSITTNGNREAYGSSGGGGGASRTMGNAQTINSGSVTVTIGGSSGTTTVGNTSASGGGAGGSGTSTANSASGGGGGSGPNPGGNGLSYVLDYANSVFNQPLVTANIGASGGQNPSGGSGGDGPQQVAYNGFQVGNSFYGSGRGVGGSQSRGTRTNGYALIVRNA